MLMGSKRPQGAKGKSKKKLTLSRETLKDLTTGGAQVKGQAKAPTDASCESCNCSLLFCSF
jgi:hypothetical protein